MGLDRFRIIWCFARVAQRERIRAALGDVKALRPHPLPSSKQSGRVIGSRAFTPLRLATDAELKLK